MPTFPFSCTRCNTEFDEVLSISERDKGVKCPDCGASAKRQVSMPHFSSNGGDVYDWHKENGGKGRRISQLDRGINKPYYARSRQTAIDEAHKRGLTVHKA